MLQAGEALPRISKTFISYMAGLMTVSPYSFGTSNKLAKGLVELNLSKTSKLLGTVSNTIEMKEIFALKVEACFNACPRLGMYHAKKQLFSGAAYYE